MIAGALAGAGFAAGLLLLAAGLWPAPAPLGRVLADYDAARSPARRPLTAGRVPGWWERRVGVSLAAGLLAARLAVRGGARRPGRAVAAPRRSSARRRPPARSPASWSRRWSSPAPVSPVSPCRC